MEVTSKLNKILSLISLLVFAACSSQPVPPSAAQIAQNKKAWENVLQEEDVSYVTLNKRLPNALSKYETDGLCHGLPRIKVRTAPGFCLGLVDTGDGMGMPRTALALSDTQIAVTDMGSWEAGIGKLFLLTWNGQSYVRKTLLDAKTMRSRQLAKVMDRPHLIARGPDGKIYVGGAAAIGTLNPLANDVESTVQIVIDNLPVTGLHPLKSFTFDAKGGRLFVNSGAATNVCQKDGMQGARARHCVAAETAANGEGQVWVYTKLPNGRYNPQHQIYAKGLRNSMALYWDEERQALLEADNGRDSINKFSKNLDDKLFPHEEFNVVRQGKHYGWPYCYDNNQANPEWSYMNCAGYAAPYLLLPPHAAPLSLIKYGGKMFPEKYRGRYLMSLHGYAPAGHRLVTFSRDQAGLPTGVPLSLIYAWDSRGEQMRGAPVGLSEMPDGSLLIVEDLSRKVVRLFYDASEGNGDPVREIDQVPVDPQKPAVDETAARKALLEAKLKQPNPPVFSQIQTKMVDKYCAACHGGADSPGISLLEYDDVGNAKRIRDNKKAQEVLMRVSADPNWPQMPPQGMDTPAEQAEVVRLIKAWIAAGQPMP